jgi:hypothetical protein
MVHQSKREYLEAIRERYRNAGRKYKRLILDEFCENCGYHRKHAIRLLNGKGKPGPRRPGPARIYGEAVGKALKDLWLKLNRSCSKVLKAAIPLWLPFYERTVHLSPGTRAQLLRISPASIDRLLRPVRQQYGSHGRVGTRPNNRLKHQVPIRTSHAGVDRPGFIQADSVSHGGDSTEGDYLWTVTLTDVFSQWTECRVVWNKGYEGVAQAVRSIEQQLPFPILAFHSDNGGEFLNHHLRRYLRQRQIPVEQTRARPDHKDDNAHVEQKNWTHVRQLLGFQRLDNPELLAPINRLYEAWDLLQNFFCPTLKLKSKTKIGSRYLRRYESPRTPCQRLLDCPVLNEALKTHLTERKLNINPLHLKKFIDHHQRLVLSPLR